MSKILVTARLVLGAIYFIFGLNGFFGFLPQPALPETAGVFLGGLVASGYFFPFLKGLEVVAGAALITNAFAPLALIVLAPVTIHIFLFHAVLTPGLANLVLPAVMVAASLVLATGWKERYEPLLQR